MASVSAVLLAGGSGSRLELDIPKQFYRVNGRMILDFSLEMLSKFCDSVVIVCHPDWIPELKRKYPRLKIVEGGETRQLSVYNGLQSLSADSPQWVLVHDSARPFISASLMERCVRGVKEKGSAIPVIRIADTLCELGSEGELLSYPDRSRFGRVQTPQAFVYRTLLDAHQNALDEGRINFTDDAQVYAFAGNSVYSVDGENENVKITYPQDLRLFEKASDKEE